MTRPALALTLLTLLTACEGDAVEGSFDALAYGTGRFDVRAPTVRNLAVSGTTQLQDGRRVVSTREVVITGQVTDVSGVAGVCVGEGLKACTDFAPWQGEVTVELSPEEGEKFVQLWFKDGRGNISPNAHGVRVTLDRFGPDSGQVEATLRPGAVMLDWWGFVDAGVGVAGYIVVQKEGGFPADCDDGEVIYVGERTGMRVTDLTMGARTGWRICGVDAVGHVGVGAVVDAVPQPELEAPVVTAFTTADGQTERNARVVDLRVAATDESGVAAMCVTTGLTCSDWTAFSTEPRVVLPAVDGPHMVYLWLEDALGNRTRNPSRLLLQLTQPIDLDGDGVAEQEDCDDKDPNVRPGAMEICNGIDDNCDGLADDDDPGLLLSSGQTFFLDKDADGYGDPAEIVRACAQPARTAVNSLDCDDNDGALRPGAAEACDGGDNDCDGVVDEDQALSSEALWFAGDAGASGDGYVVGGPGAWGAAHLPLALGEEREQLQLSLDRPAGAAFALAMDGYGKLTGPDVLAGGGSDLRLRVDDAGVTVWGSDGAPVTVADGALPPAMGPRSLLILIESDRAHVYVDGMPVAEDVLAMPGEEVTLAGEGGAVELPAATWTCAI